MKTSVYNVLDCFWNVLQSMFSVASSFFLKQVKSHNWILEGSCIHIRVECYRHIGVSRVSVPLYRLDYHHKQYFWDNSIVKSHKDWDPVTKVANKDLQYTPLHGWRRLLSPLNGNFFRSMFLKGIKKFNNCRKCFPNYIIHRKLKFFL